MRVLSFVNQKGGCGKTTVAVNLAAALARVGERVLLVDLDPQAHASLAMSCDGERELGVRDVLLEGVAPEHALFAAPAGVALLAANARLADFEDAAARTIRPEHVLRDALASLASRFDHVLIDCPARADGVLSTSALRASDFAVLVVETGAIALQGAVRAKALFDDLGASQSTALEVRVLGTLFDRRTKCAREILLAMHARFGPQMFDTVVRESVRLREAAARGVPIQLHAPRSGACEDFAALADEVRALQTRLEHARDVDAGLGVEREPPEKARAPRPSTPAARLG